MSKSDVQKNLVRVNAALLVRPSKGLLQLRKSYEDQLRYGFKGSK